MPPDAHLVEQVSTTEVLLDGGFLKVHRDVVVLPDGQPAPREYIVHPGAVAVVALLDDGQIVMERQWRHPLRQVLLEIPAGKRDPGESASACAVRELREETGYQAHEWARAGVVHVAAAYSTEGIEIWFARGLSAGPQQLDAGEFVEVVSRSADELDALAAAGELTDAKTLAGLMWLQRWRAGAWLLTWRDAATMAA